MTLQAKHPYLWHALSGWLALAAAAGCGSGPRSQTEITGTSQFAGRQLVASGPRGTGPIGRSGSWSATGGLQTSEVRQASGSGARLYAHTAHAGVTYSPLADFEVAVLARLGLGGAQNASTVPLPSVRGTLSPELAAAVRTVVGSFGPCQALLGLHVAGSVSPFRRESAIRATETRTYPDCDSSRENCPAPTVTRYETTESINATALSLEAGAQLSLLVEPARHLHIELGSVFQVVPTWVRLQAISADCNGTGPACLQQLGYLPSGRQLDPQVAPFLAVAWRTGPVSLLAHAYSLLVSQRINVPVAGGGAVHWHF